MSEQWYYTRDRKQTGPISEAELKEMASSGQLSATDLVWMEGMPKWVRAEEIKGLFANQTPSGPRTRPASPTHVTARSNAAQTSSPTNVARKAKPSFSYSLRNLQVRVTAVVLITAVCASIGYGLFQYFGADGTTPPGSAASTNRGKGGATTLVELLEKLPKDRWPTDFNDTLKVAQANNWYQKNLVGQRASWNLPSPYVDWHPNESGKIDVVLEGFSPPIMLFGRGCRLYIVKRNTIGGQDVDRRPASRDEMDGGHYRFDVKGLDDQAATVLQGLVKAGSVRVSFSIKSVGHSGGGVEIEVDGVAIEGPASRAENPSDSKGAIETPTLSADRLGHEFRADLLTTRLKYQGKTVEVTGMVTAVDAYGKVYLDNEVLCQFASRPQVTENQRLTVRGKFSRESNYSSARDYVIIEDCELLSQEGNETQNVKPPYLRDALGQQFGVPSAPPHPANQGTVDNEAVQIADVRTAPRFTQPPLVCTSPCWSPDGNYVMFVAKPTEEAGGEHSTHPAGSDALPGNVWVVSADGSKRWLVSNFFFNMLQLPAGRRADPLQLDVRAVAWSPDGQKIAFRANTTHTRTNLYVMRADGAETYQVAEDKGWRESGETLQWTPDGKRLLLSGRSTAMIDLDGTTLSPITAPGGGEITHACSSLDGKQLAAIAKGGAEWAFGVTDVDLRRWRWLARGQQFAGQDTRYHPRSWSPDATQIAADAADWPGDRYIAVFDVASRKVRRLVDGAAPAWSPDGQRVVFEGGRGDEDNLYVIGPDGKNMRRITNLTPPGLQMIWGSQPSWSPDGMQIVFRRNGYIWIANRDGTGQTSVVQCIDSAHVSGALEWIPFWKPDGGIFFIRHKEAQSGVPAEIEMAVTDVSGTEVRPLLLFQPVDGGIPCWSPDGSRMAFDKNANIWVANGDGTEQRRLTGGRNPRWCPDGEKILYVRGNDRNEVLCIINTDGSNQTQITEPSDGINHHSWCPDSKNIAFVGAVEGQYGLWIVSANGGDARRLVPSVFQPCWSPDGQKMAFVVGEGKSVDFPAAMYASCVYVIDADGTGIRPVLQVGTTGNRGNRVSSLSWSPDGKHIVFEETAEVRRGYGLLSQHHIWIVDISTPVFYEASYVASDLLPWEVPGFK